MAAAAAPTIPTAPRVVWFDMDHTLIANDCDVSWKHFMVRKGLADAGTTERLTEAFYQDYCAGTLDNGKFLDFQLAEFVGRDPETMAALAAEHFESVVRAKIYPGMGEIVRKVREERLPSAIVTSTNSVIARPVAEYFGVDELFGAELELNAAGQYTGKCCGVYPVGAGKVEILRRCCAATGMDPTTVAFYGDSINDAAILSAVGHPFTVNPSPALRELAIRNQWPILNMEVACEHVEH